jgi:hypothetical protein
VAKNFLVKITDYITKLCRQQSQIIQNHKNAQREAVTENKRGLNLAAVRRTTAEMTKLPL